MYCLKTFLVEDTLVLKSSNVILYLKEDDLRETSQFHSVWAKFGISKTCRPGVPNQKGLLPTGITRPSGVGCDVTFASSRDPGCWSCPSLGPTKNQTHPVGDWEPLSVFKQENNTVKPELEMIALMVKWKEQEQKRKRLVSGEPIIRHAPGIMIRICNKSIY